MTAEMGHIEASPDSEPDRNANPGLITIVLALVALPIIYDSIELRRVSLTLLLFLAILGVNLATGYCGLISLGHGAFIGVGAFGTAWFLDAQSLPWLIAILGGVLAAAVAGLIVGIPALRIRGIHLALVTLGMAIVFQPLARRFPQFSGGVSGKAVRARIVAPAWLGDSRFANTFWQYCIVVFACVVGLLLVRNLVNSRWGRALRAVRDDEQAAAIYGVNLTHARVGAFAASAALAGLAGAMQVVLFPWVSPDAYTTFDSLTIYAVAVIGGLGTLRGSILGVATLILVPRLQAGFASRIADESGGGLWLDLLSNEAVLFGVALTVLTLAFPGGLASIDTRPMGSRLRRFGSGIRRLLAGRYRVE